MSWQAPELRKIKSLMPDKNSKNKDNMIQEVIKHYFSTS